MVEVRHKLALFIFITVLHFEVGKSINCLSCQNVLEPGLCETVIECQENQACYIESVMSLTTHQLSYNLGCKPITTCNLIKCSKDAFAKRNENDVITNNNSNVTHLTVCIECCYGQSCNFEGCGYKLPISDLIQCFDCKEVHNDGPPCITMRSCNRNIDVCSVSLSQRSISAGAYDLGCTGRKLCELLLSLQGDRVDPNVKCCDTFLCNVDPYTPSVNSSSALAGLACPPDLIKPTTPSTTPLTTPTTTMAPWNLTCLHCINAGFIDDCIGNITCDGLTEECYMDELVTDQLTLVYDGGCRSKQVCHQGLGKKKRSGFDVGCSRYIFNNLNDQ